MTDVRTKRSLVTLIGAAALWLAMPAAICGSGETAGLWR
jgi:hypothetical protein